MHNNEQGTSIIEVAVATAIIITLTGLSLGPLMEAKTKIEKDITTLQQYNQQLTP